MKNILDQFHLLVHMFCLLKKDKKTKINFFYAKEFEIGYVLIFSSVKISTYKYYKTNKTLCFIYHCLRAHRISPPQKKFLIIEMKLRHCITLQKNTEKTILLHITVTDSRGTYLGINQSMNKFVSSAANTWKSRMFDIDFVVSN